MMKMSNEMMIRVVQNILTFCVPLYVFKHSDSLFEKTRKAAIRKGGEKRALFWLDRMS
jgi:hypothetical protein